MNTDSGSGSVRNEHELLQAVGAAAGGLDALRPLPSSEERRSAEPPPVRDRLRRETASAHAGLERQLDLLNPDLTLARYEAVLRAFFGFYRPLEASLLPLLPASPPLGFAAPDRAPLLARDLRYLGRSPDEIGRLPRCADLPAMCRVEHLAGALYVLEGAGLGAKVVARALENNLQLRSDAGAAFFADGAHDAAARWRLTVRWLNHLSSLPDVCVDEIVSSARGVFSSLSHWTGSTVGCRD